MTTAVRTRRLAYGTRDSRRDQAFAVRDGTLAIAVGQILSKSRAFAVSSRVASSSVRFATSFDRCNGREVFSGTRRNNRDSGDERQNRVDMHRPRTSSAVLGQEDAGRMYVYCVMDCNCDRLGDLASTALSALSDAARTPVPERPLERHHRDGRTIGYLRTGFSKSILIV
jgi:hypothetical protein